MELGKVLAPLQPVREKMLFIRGLYNAEALKGNIHSSQTGNLLSGAHLGHRRRDPLRHQHRPGPRRAAWAIRPRCRAWCWAASSRSRRSTRTTRCSTARTSRGARRPRRRRWSSTRRWRSTGCSTTKSAGPTRACSTPCSTTPAGFANTVSTVRPAQARRISSSVREVEQRIEQAGKDRPAARLAADARQAEHAAPGRRHPAGHRRAHAADVRHPGARLPDRHDARLHAQAEQRPLLAALPEPRRCDLHDPPSAVALRQRPTG